MNNYNKNEIIEKVICIINNKNLLLKEFSNNRSNLYLFKMYELSEKEIELFINQASFMELVEISKAYEIDNKYMYKIEDLLYEYGIEENSIPFNTMNKIECDLFYLIDCIVDLSLIVQVDMDDIDLLLQYFRTQREGYKCIELCERYDYLESIMNIQIVKESYLTIAERYLTDLNEMVTYDENIPYLSLKTLLTRYRGDKILCFFYLLAYDCFINHENINDCVASLNTVKIIEKGYAFMMFVKLENLRFEYKNNLIYVTFNFDITKPEIIDYSKYF